MYKVIKMKSCKGTYNAKYRIKQNIRFRFKNTFFVCLFRLTLLFLHRINQKPRLQYYFQWFQVYNTRTCPYAMWYYGTNHNLASYQKEFTVHVQWSHAFKHLQTRTYIRTFAIRFSIRKNPLSPCETKRQRIW